MKILRRALAVLLLLTLFAITGCSYISDVATCDKPQDPNASIAACTRLIQSGRLNPTALAGALTNRAAAYFNLHQLDSSLADLDEAIRTQPDFALAWGRRGALHAMRGEMGKALSDARQAVALNPKDVDARLALAEILGTTHDFPGQLAVLDAVIGESPDNPSALNSRCWARATHNTGLEQALADCNASLRLRPDAAATLDSRGFTYLRMGRYADAIRDYDAAIARAPGLAPSFYGRGVARKAMGDTAGSVSDINSAKSLFPEVVHQFQEYGIEPP